MSVETLPIESFESIKTDQSLYERSDEQILAELEGILSATTMAEAKNEQLSFEEIGRIFTEAHDARVIELQREKQGMILEAMLDNPADAFRAEFLQLKLLYEDRSLLQTSYDGSSNLRFCTQNHEAGKADSVFREYTSSQGAVTYEVRKFYTYSGEPRLGTVTLKNGELSVVEQGWRRGAPVYTELEGADRERMLAELFYGTIYASALQFERGPGERAENNQRAKGYIYDMMRKQDILY